MIPKHNESYPQVVDKNAGGYVGRVRLIRMYIYMTRPANNSKKLGNFTFMPLFISNRFVRLVLFRD